ncbi:MAG TPA: retention module-containing protein, partial [Gordonia sp. (in: high G+C Gram-positive bacteria)]|nr:retention module-containing protein [Gordonia sp. (in: high G+C Gram-positive bacteria)]
MAINQPVATVVAVIGEAYARNADGAMRVLKAGDALYEGEVVITRNGGRVELATSDGQLLEVQPNETIAITAELSDTTRPTPQEAAVGDATIDRVIQAINDGGDIDDAIDAPAAGLNGGAGGDGNSFVRLLRITEGVDPLEFEFGTARPGPEFVFDGGTGDDNVSAVETAGVTAVISISGESSVIEGESITYTISVDKAPTSALTVNVVTGHITTDNGDLIPVTTAVTIAAGATSTTFTVSTLDDAYADSGEQFTASIASTSGGGYGSLVLGTSSVTTTILDQVGSDDPPGAEDTATISIAGAASVVEGEVATYTVSVDKAPATALTVNVVTGHITTDNGDLVPVTTAVTIAAGSTSATFNVTTLDDAYADSGETFTASIASTSGGGYENLVVGTSSVTTTILDQTGSDNPPGAEDTATISIAGQASVIEGEVATYTVSVDKAPATALTVNVVTGHITTDNGDLVPVTTAVTIAAGSTSATFNVTTLDDAYADSGETFTASIASTSGGGY